jgi:putative DNA primase/helicase
VQSPPKDPNVLQSQRLLNDPASLLKFAARASGEARSHSAIASEVYYEITRNDGQAPLADAGALFRFDPSSGLWLRQELDTLASHIGQTNDEPNCKTLSAYKAIAVLVYHRTRNRTGRDGSPFDAAPPGVAANGFFYQVASDGSAIVSEKLTAQHLARFAVPVTPDKSCPTPLFDSLLSASFPSTDFDHEEQRGLLKQHFGACVIGAMPRMQKACLWRGVARSGKSTLQEVLRSLFRREDIAAVPPHLWHREYHVAALAGKILNTVGEIDAMRPLTSAFKNVIGRDLLHGRHVTHRPFSFRNEASQIFASNNFPPTEDESESFFDRWSCIEFRHSRAANERDDRLGEKIIRGELSGVLAFALEGARELVAKGGRFTLTTAHRTAIEAWRGRSDSVGAWLRDRDAVELRRDFPADDQNGWLHSRTRLHDHYDEWCQHAGRRPLALHHFDEVVRNHFAEFGMREDHATHKIWGIRPRQESR